MKLLKALAVAVGTVPSSSSAENQTLLELVRNDQSFELMRNMTDVVNPALLRYLVQLELDTSRIEYLYAIDRHDATIVKFQLDSQRSSDFGQGLLAELTAHQIPQPLIEKAVLDIWQVISLSNECFSEAACKGSETVRSDVNEIVQGLFPELISPESGDTAGTTSPLSNVVKNLINERITYGCDGRSGMYNPQGITVADLDGDNRDDLILDDGAISCTGLPQTSITCGARACEIAIYLMRGDILNFEVAYLGIGAQVGEGVHPTISGYGNDLSNYSIGWDGQKFARR